MSELFGKLGLNLVSHQSATLIGEAAMGLYTYCILYSRLHELDGMVPRHIAERGWSCDLESNRRHLETLCSSKVRFLSQMEDGDFVIEKFAEWNETKEQIEDRRGAAKERKQKYVDRSKGVSSEEASSSKNVLGTRSEHVPNTSEGTRSEHVPSGSVFVSGSGSGLSFNSEEGVGEPPRANDLESGVMRIAAPQSEPDLEPEPAVHEPATSHERYAKAYAEGQIEAGAEAYPWEGMQSDHSALALMCAFAKGLRGKELLAWFRDVSSDFRQSVDGTYNPGFRPTKCLEWLKGGRPKRQQSLKLVQGIPESGRLWKVGGG